MSKSINSLILHIVQPDETLETIAEKYQSTVEEIKSLNVSVRIKKLYVGMPLNIKDNRIRKAEINFKDNEANQFEISDIAFFTKELILAKIFFEKAESVMENSLKSSIQFVFDKYANLSKSLKNKIYEIHSLIIQFIPDIQSKNSDNIKETIDKINELIEEIKSIMPQNFSFKSVKYLINSLIKYWQLYILKILTLDFENAEKIFNDILQKYRALTIKKPNE